MLGYSAAEEYFTFVLRIRQRSQRVRETPPRNHVSGKLRSSLDVASDDWWLLPVLVGACALLLLGYHQRVPSVARIPLGTMAGGLFAAYFFRFEFIGSLVWGRADEVFFGYYAHLIAGASLFLAAIGLTILRNRERIS